MNFVRLACLDQNLIRQLESFVLFLKTKIALPHPACVGLLKKYIAIISIRSSIYRVNVAS